MEIHKNIEIIDLSLKYKDILILPDMHIGYEEALNKQGILIPRSITEDLIKRLENILSKVKVKKIIVNGDIKHEFGTISRQEWRDTLKVLELLEKHGEVILVKGNHDTILGPIADKKNIKIVDYFKIDDITILHGHKIISNLSKTIIIGHEHPAISFKERPYEKFKCFIKGRWNKHMLIVMPSLNLLVEGSDITKEKKLSPFLQKDLSNFEVYAVPEMNNIMYFKKIKDIEKATL